jgi:hypothetical protein
MSSRPLKEGVYAIQQVSCGSGAHSVVVGTDKQPRVQQRKLKLLNPVERFIKSIHLSRHSCVGWDLLDKLLAMASRANSRSSAGCGLPGCQSSHHEIQRLQASSSCMLRCRSLSISALPAKCSAFQ